MYNCQDEDSDIGLSQLLRRRQIRNLGCKTLHQNFLGIFFCLFWWWWGGSYSWELVFLRITLVFRKWQTSFKFVFVLSCTSRFARLLILSMLEELAYFGLENAFGHSVKKKLHKNPKNVPGIVSQQMTTLRFRCKPFSSSSSLLLFLWIGFKWRCRIDNSFSFSFLWWPTFR